MNKNDYLASLYSMRSNMQYQVDEKTEEIRNLKLEVRKAELTQNDDTIQKYIQKHSKEYPIDDHSKEIQNVTRKISMLNDDINDFLNDISKINEIILYIKSSDPFDPEEFQIQEMEPNSDINDEIDENITIGDNLDENKTIDNDIQQHQIENIDPNMILVDKFALFELQNQLTVNIKNPVEKLLFHINNAKKFVKTDLEESLLNIQLSITQTQKVLDNINQIIFDYFIDE